MWSAPFVYDITYCPSVFSSEPNFSISTPTQISIELCWKCGSLHLLGGLLRALPHAGYRCRATRHVTQVIWRPRLLGSTCFIWLSARCTCFIGVSWPGWTSPSQHCCLNHLWPWGPFGFLTSFIFYCCDELEALIFHAFSDLRVTFPISEHFI